eukprot:3941737-Rhodomonas_salina.8
MEWTAEPGSSIQYVSTGQRVGRSYHTQGQYDTPRQYRTARSKHRIVAPYAQSVLDIAYRKRVGPYAASARDIA